MLLFVVLYPDDSVSGISVYISALLTWCSGRLALKVQLLQYSGGTKRREKEHTCGSRVSRRGNTSLLQLKVDYSGGR